MVSLVNKPLEIYNKVANLGYLNYVTVCLVVGITMHRDSQMGITGFPVLLQTLGECTINLTN